MKTKFSPDIGIRWLIATAKVAVLFGLLLFLLSFCSCSSARKADSMSISSSDTISVVSASSDSVGSVSSETSWYSRLVEISGLEIIFPEPGRCLSGDTTDMVSPEQVPRASPSKIRIDALSVATSAGSSAVQAKDSVSSAATSESAAARSESSEVKVRSPDSTKWQAVLVLAFVLLVIAYTGYSLWSSNRPRDQTSET